MFLGIDLAADPARTGLAVLIDGHITAAQLGASDAEIAAAVATATKAGVDVPLGWPQAFVNHVSAHARGVQKADESGPQWRRTMALRRTDVVVQERFGQRPLSVSTDLIAHPALRWSVIEAQLLREGINTARDGSGTVAEVYPAAALKAWGLPHRGYKKRDATELRAQIVAALPVEVGEFRKLCLASDDVLDAVIAAVVAREVEAGRTLCPSASEVELAQVEGWIHVPV